MNFASCFMTHQGQDSVWLKENKKKPSGQQIADPDGFIHQTKISPSPSIHSPLLNHNKCKLTPFYTYPQPSVNKQRNYLI